MDRGCACAQKSRVEARRPSERASSALTSTAPPLIAPAASASEVEEAWSYCRRQSKARRLAPRPVRPATHTNGTPAPPANPTDDAPPPERGRSHSSEARQRGVCRPRAGALHTVSLVGVGASGSLLALGAAPEARAPARGAPRCARTMRPPGLQLQPRPAHGRDRGDLENRPARYAADPYLSDRASTPSRRRPAKDARGPHPGDGCPSSSPGRARRAEARRAVPTEQAPPVAASPWSVHSATRLARARRRSRRRSRQARRRSAPCYRLRADSHLQSDSPLLIIPCTVRYGYCIPVSCRLTGTRLQCSLLSQRADT